MNPLDLVGSRSGQLVVQALSGWRSRNSKKYLYYLCLCDCGRTCTIARNQILQNKTKSCGCLKKRKGPQNPGWKGAGELTGAYWTRVQHHATSRDIPLHVSIDAAWTQFQKQKGRCALTGWNITFSPHLTEQTASLDRIDSTKGYTVDNIQWVHKDVNLLKWDLPEHELIAWCQKVVDYVGSSTTYRE